MRSEDKDKNVNKEENSREDTKLDGSNKKGLNHMTTIRKWGNSLAIRIPNQFAKTLGIKNGSEIELQLLDEKMVVKSVKTKPTLEDLLAKAKGETNPHLDYDFGKPEGKELI
ncbi:AbrB/MazE/SpoVT family DNA-binding domain-containing protein [Evansella halocellulosilytica]|uniref:AbrB/MazE/SpoVT family DNA-binding domain-containing protein n=1 Tax=Evansella halocellulosilytica TaxID=2011013 RepID=UPI00211CF5C9|nr:AbrB/MazE/SpoVT family DNA-binding domain-containing protein [Evansella halocellulosilytica]